MKIGPWSKNVGSFATIVGTATSRRPVAYLQHPHSFGGSDFHQAGPASGRRVAPPFDQHFAVATTISNHDARLPSAHHKPSFAPRANVCGGPSQLRGADYRNRQASVAARWCRAHATDCPETPRLRLTVTEMSRSGWSIRREGAWGRRRIKGHSACWCADSVSSWALWFRITQGLFL